jgi:palmitoyl-protein thioesterase
VLGLSQGGLLARYIAEECEMPGKVRNLATLGGPNKGVGKIPNCFSGVICDAVNYVARSLVYLSIVQEYCGPCGYFRDPSNLSTYLANNVFLPYDNNERSPSSSIKERFSALNGVLLGMFSEDTMVFPKESEWFWELNADLETVTPLNQTDFYKSDLIGLRSLDEAGKVQFVTFIGEHLQFSEAEID